MEILEPVRVAVLGAGLFARDAYVPSLRQQRDHARVVCVWSRSNEAASQQLAADLSDAHPGVEALHGDGALASILARPDVEAVLVVLPPQAYPAVVRAALLAGKAVLTEKPAAASGREAEELLAWWRSLPAPAPLWAVAENYRSEPAFVRLRQALAAGSLGDIIKIDVTANLPMNPGNKYYGSTWRRDSATLAGGFLTDSAVHFAAALRAAAAAAGAGEAVGAAGFARGAAAGLPAPDTVVGVVQFESGVASSFSVTMGSGVVLFCLRVVGTQGSAEVVRGGFGGAGAGYELRLVPAAGAGGQASSEKLPFGGVEAELASFARAVRAGASSASTPGNGTASSTASSNGTAGADLAEDLYRISADEAVRDLVLVEALLESSTAGGGAVGIRAMCG